MTDKERIEKLEAEVATLKKQVSDLEYTVGRIADNVNQNSFRQLNQIRGQARGLNQ